MIIKEFIFNSAKSGDKKNIYVLGDLHIGCRTFMQDEYSRIADIIRKDPDAYVLLLGDLTDDDRPSTRAMRRAMFADRHEAFTQEDNQHLGYMDRVVIPEISRILKPGRCLGALDGDHFRRYANGLSSVQYICAKLKLPYLGDGQAIISLSFGKGKCNIQKCLNFVIHAQHGVGGTGRLGNGVNKLDDISSGWDGIDCLVRAHNHKAFIHPTGRNYYDRHRKIIGKRNVWLVNSPSFRGGMSEGFTDYSEAKCYGPTPNTFPVIKLEHKKDGRNNGNPYLNVSGELI